MSKSDQAYGGTDSAYFLVGPTAVGKTSTAHALADLHPDSVLISADAMLIYEGMDVGTDKPGADEIARYGYYGVNLAKPNEEFSVGAYISAIRPVIAKTLSDGKKPIIVGGTGLYVKCLIEGLVSENVDPEIRVRVESLYESGGRESLKAALRDADPRVLAGLSDPENPRRLMRALEQVYAGKAQDRSWTAEPTDVLAGLSMEREMLHARIRERVSSMYQRGLLDEVEGLLAMYGRLSRCAAQAIGYSEALAVLSGDMTQEEAVEKTVIRTRKLAKKQMTWFRHQANITWIEVNPGTDAEQAAREVTAVWNRYGPTGIRS